LERRVRGINGNGGRCCVDEVLERALGSRGYIFETSDGGSAVAGRVSARVGSSGGVRVRGFSINSLVVDDVLESIIHETTVATFVTFGGGAINEILLREADKAASRKEVSSFSGTSGGERPARSALSLVLDPSYGSLGSPVNSGG
jgi:hypothetical protein